MKQSAYLFGQKIARHSGYVPFVLAILLSFSLFAFSSARAEKPYGGFSRTANQHQISCSVLDNTKMGRHCYAFYVFPRSVRTIMLSDLQPGKKYQCYFKGYNTWRRTRSSKIVRKKGLVGLSVSNKKYATGSGISADIDSTFRLRNPLKIRVKERKRGGWMSFDLKNHTRRNGNYVTISCHEVHSFSVS